MVVLNCASKKISSKNTWLKDKSRFKKHKNFKGRRKTEKVFYTRIDIKIYKQRGKKTDDDDD